MTQTYWCPGPWPWQWFRTCTREVPDPPFDPCKAPACVDAKAGLASARGRFTSICQALQMLNALSELLARILATPVWIIIVLAIIAAIIGGWIAVIIWGLIAIYGISWLLFFVVGTMTRTLLKSLAQAQLDFAEALKSVMADCPEPCRGDVSIPTCNLEKKHNPEF